MSDTGKARRGFTLVELVVAGGISTLVLAGVASLFVGTYRLSRQALADTEAMIRLRAVRERLLFQAVPEHDGIWWAGVLSGSGRGVEGGTKILMNAYGIGLADGRARAQQIQLVRHSEVVAGTWRGWLVNDGDRNSPDWLRPSGAGCIPATDWLDDTELAGRNLFFVLLETSVGGDSRRMRVAVPLFGTVQARNSTDVFGRR